MVRCCFFFVLRCSLSFFSQFMSILISIWNSIDIQLLPNSYIYALRNGCDRDKKKKLLTVSFRKWIEPPYIFIASHLNLRTIAGRSFGKCYHEINLRVKYNARTHIHTLISTVKKKSNIIAWIAARIGHGANMFLSEIHNSIKHFVCFIPKKFLSNRLPFYSCLFLCLHTSSYNYFYCFSCCCCCYCSWWWW